MSVKVDRESAKRQRGTPAKDTIVKQNNPIKPQPISKAVTDNLSKLLTPIFQKKTETINKNANIDKALRELK